jgi:hypothetical protein
MTTPVQDLAAQWNSARRLYPIYVDLAREFAIDLKACADLEAGVETPGKESIQQANQWLDQLDNSIQVHQLRQFLQTNALVTQEGMISLIQHFLAKKEKTNIVRDKIDFLVVQYFSQVAPTGIDDNQVDLAFVAQAMEPIVGQVELKTPLWLNALERVLESARRCRSLDELLHGGILEQGRKAKGQAGDLFYLPIALVAFTRFGYLMRRVFFRLMLGDLNVILDGLTELEKKGIDKIDCRRAQFSNQEPIMRLRMICQSWKVMFQAEYSSGSPLRMLVDLKASVEHALGRGKSAEPAGKGKPGTGARVPIGQKPAAAKASAAAAGAASPSKPAPSAAKSAAASRPEASNGASKSVQTSPTKSSPKAASAKSSAPEFEVSGGSDWNPDTTPATPKKK